MKADVILGGFFIMAISVTGCGTSSAKANAEDCSVRTEPAKIEVDVKTQFGLNDVQILCGEKAVKLPLENNPVTNLKFSADPAVLVYNDTIYLYATNDSQQMAYSLGKEDNGFGKINTLNIYSSKDMVNWTYEGEIPVAGKNNPKGPAKWATNSWAPAVCTKKVNGKDKVFLYFADSGNGIGVLTADTPTGPFVDPIGKPLVSHQTPNTEKVYWLFDPAVFIDDDGKGYLYCGGGHQADFVHPKSARCIALNDDMVSLACDPIEMDPPYLFEDSGINKINGKYVYSYCTNWTDRQGAKGPEVSPIAVIAYMTSDNPLGPWKYQGWFLKNPASYFGCAGNNHHWVFNFKGKWYVAYHAQVVEKQINLEKGGYRNLFINELKINKDGSIPVQENITKEGVKSVCNFDPYTEIPAVTMHSSSRLACTDKKTLVPVKDGAYALIKNVDLSSGVAEVTIKTGSKSTKGQVIFMLDNQGSGPELAYINIGKAGKGEYKVQVNFPATKEPRNLYIKLNGAVELVSWKFSK